MDAGYRIKSGTGPASMTPSMFIYEFSHSLIRRNDGVTVIYPQIFLKSHIF